MRLRLFLRALFGRWTRPTPVPRHRATTRPCDLCGRTIAHTLSGRPYLHRCRPELLKTGERDASTDS